MQSTKSKNIKLTKAKLKSDLIKAWVLMAKISLIEPLLTLNISMA